MSEDRVEYEGQDRTGRPIVEELVTHNATVHIERMNNDSYFVSITKPDGENQRFWMSIGKSGELEMVPEM